MSNNEIALRREGKGQFRDHTRMAPTPKVLAVAYDHSTRFKKPPGPRSRHHHPRRHRDVHHR
jgi:hypothetical protein